MRDVDRLREKTQVSLDDRQIAALAVGALLLLGGVFALGLLVGKHLAAQAQPATTEIALEDPAPPKAAQGRAPAVHVAQAAPAEPPRPPAVIPPPKPAVTVPPPEKPAVVAPEKEKVKEKPIVLTPPPKELGDYTVQVGASQDRAEAQRIEQKARAAGLKPYVVEADLGSRGTWYRVRVGAFKDKDSAGRFRKDVERELRSAAVVMSTH